MPYQTILHSIALAALLVGSYADLKTREVPDWLNFGLIFGGIGIRLLFSAYTMTWQFVLEGLLGLGVMMALAYFLFYTGQVGGGDAKLFMGLGSVFGLQLSWESFLFAFVINVFLVGSFYGACWSIMLATQHRRAFIGKWRTLVRSAMLVRFRKYALVVCGILLLLALWTQEIFLRMFLLTLILLYIISFYVWIFAKAVEQSCMMKYVKPSQLTVGDWIPREVCVRGKVIAGPKDLGITEKQIQELQRRKIRQVLIKEGIPFVPSFLLGFLLTLSLGNPLLYLSLL